MKAELGLLPTDQRQRFLQIAIITLGWCVCPGMLKSPKITNLLFHCNILQKELSDEVDLFHTGKHESLPQIDSMQMIRNSQSSQNSKFAMSLQYLKKLKAEFDFLPAEFPKCLFQHFEHQSCLQG